MGRQLVQIGEYIASAAQGEHLAHDLLAVHGVDRSIVHLQEDRHDGLAAVLEAQVLDALFERLRRCLGLHFRIGELTQRAKRSADIRKPMRSDRDDIESQILQSLHDTGRSARLPHQDGIRAQRQQPLEVDAECIADTRQSPGLCRIVAVFDRTYHARPCAGRERKLGEIRSQTHDA